MSTDLKPKKLSLPKKNTKSEDGESTLPSTPQFTKKLPPRFDLKSQRQSALQQVAQFQKKQAAGLIRGIEKERESSVIVYFSRNLLNGEEVKNFYQLFEGNSKFDNLDLILHSNGGVADDAFKMCRLCRQHTKDKFSVIVPYRAKSAATLLALGADELIMGPASELGPIDPMIYIRLQDGNQYLVPAHSVKDGLDFFEGRIKADPDTALIYSRLLDSLDPTVIGAYQRAIESSKQYAETLLAGGLLKGKQEEEIETVATNLAEKYKSHGFVIDRDIARKEYGLNVVDATESMWTHLWQLYNLLDVWLEDDPKIGSIVRTSNSELIIGRQLNRRQTGKQGDKNG